MTKTRILTLAVIVLVVLNLALAAFLIMGRPGPKKPPGPKHQIIKLLNLNAEQVVAYEGLIERHRESVNNLDSLILNAKQILYMQTEKQDSALIEAQILLISQLTQELERTHIVHFVDLKGICTDDQMPAFKELAKDLSVYFSPKQHKKRRR
ncbi:MAG: hypothetical protein ACI9FU_001233 [Granulosicoccus sp.]|jgi:hypothetical protein